MKKRQSNSLMKGKSLDAEGRCEHYHTSSDVVCIQFKCCDEYYACYQCHQELTTHQPVRYEKAEFDEQAILCGVCKNTCSIQTYLQVNTCPHCDSQWNPNCENHYALYFHLE